TVQLHKGFINDIKFLPDNSGFLSVASDHTVRFTNHVTGQGKILTTLPYDLKSIDVNADGSMMAGVSTSGHLVLLNLKDNSVRVEDLTTATNPARILSVAFHPTKSILAYGAEFLDKNDSKWKGSVKLIDYVTMDSLKELRGHKAGVTDVEFSPNGELLASAGLDKKLQMWVVDNVEDLPVVMDFNSSNIWRLAFAHGSDYLLASCNNGEVRVWPTNPKMLAEQICPLLKRNMTKEEWLIYVGNKIEYESTCKSLLISDF
ncbi:MAG TPA: hypothetical protein PLR06_13540, partial [Cyclobacteriaceae bacterium]|nr:hypothetical protein [Cyclobacteriaceae bacterium]